MSKLKILVTGGSGFIGSNLTQKLIDAGHELTITSLGNEPNLKVSKVLYNSLEGIDWSYIRGQNVLFHQMANNDTRCMDVSEMMRANFYGPIKLFMEALEGGCKKFVYASSTAVYGNSPAPYTEQTEICPLNPYADSKSKFDKFAMQFAKENNVSVIGLRYCNVYGPGESQKGKRMSMIGQIINKVLHAQSFDLFKDGSQKRDWVYIDDVVQANLLAMNSSLSGGHIFNIGSGSSFSFNQIVSCIEESLKTKALINWVDCSFSDTYQSHTECNIDKAKLELGYNPQFSIKCGIEDYIKRIKKEIV